MAKVLFNSVDNEDSKIEKLTQVIDEINFKEFALNEVQSLESKIVEVLKSKNIKVNVELLINLEFKGE